MIQSTARARGISGRSLLLRRVKSDCKGCQQGGSSDGFVIGNGDGILGVVSRATSTPRASAIDMIAIKTTGVSSDGRFIAAGNSFGAVEVWELR
jgi:tricorn protease-like protein